MRRYSVVAATAVLALCLVSTTSAEFVTNGGFESVAGGSFTGWTDLFPSPIVESGSVISGTYSAEIQGQNYQGVQDIAYNPDCTYSVDFACFPTSNNDDRTFNLAIAGRMAASGGGSAVVFRVVGAGTFQVYNGSTAYETVPGLSAVTTTDAGADGLWSGETPQVNHLQVVTHYSAASPSYDVTLNGTTVTGFTGFQFSSPAGNSYDNTRISLMGGSSVSNWLADNVSATVPEPSTMLMSIVGMFGLLAYAWRKRN